LIKAVIFDIDGTLVDSVDLHARAWQEALRKFGHDVPLEDVHQQIGKGGDQLIPVFLTKQEQLRFGAELEEYRGKLWKAQYISSVRPFPKVRELVQKMMDDGKQIALASSAKGDELEQYKRIAHIDDLVKKETSADDAERSKPYPDIFEAALAKLHDVDASEAVVIGDSPYDAQAAGKIGVASIAVRSGGFPEEQLRAAGYVAIFDNCADLLAHYGQSLLASRAAA
jgi:beta-phosphoglucomutase-like phosphatase (HAD superfamily)